MWTFPSCVKQSCIQEYLYYDYLIVLIYFCLSYADYSDKMQRDLSANITNLYRLTLNRLYRLTLNRFAWHYADFNWQLYSKYFHCPKWDCLYLKHVQNYAWRSEKKQITWKSIPPWIFLGNIFCNCHIPQKGQRSCNFCARSYSESFLLSSRGWFSKLGVTPYCGICIINTKGIAFVLLMWYVDLLVL